MNIYPITTCGITPKHVRVFWELERDVALGNITSVSIPSERQLIQERMVKDRKDKKKKKNNTNDVREEKSQLDGKGGEGLDVVNAIRIDNEDNNARWGDVGEGMPHH